MAIILELLIGVHYRGQFGSRLLDCILDCVLGCVLGYIFDCIAYWVVYWFAYLVLSCVLGYTFHCLLCCVLHCIYTGITACSSLPMSFCEWICLNQFHFSFLKFVQIAKYPKDFKVPGPIFHLSPHVFQFFVDPPPPWRIQFFFGDPPVLGIGAALSYLDLSCGLQEKGSKLTIFSH